MSVKTALNKAFRQLGMKNIATELGISYQAVRGWHERNRMPDTEYSCRTTYSQQIETMTGGAVTVTDLLGHIPTCQAITENKEAS